MKPTQAQPGHYYRSDDAADIWFGANKEPTTVRCGIVSCLVNEGKADVKLSTLRFLAAGLFGPGRPSDSTKPNGTKWTGDSHRYGIYAVTNEYDGRDMHDIAVLYSHGGGSGGVLLQRGDAEFWHRMTRILDSATLWDLCASVVESFEAGEDAERRRIFQAAIDNRLKVNRRKRDRVTVEILPKPTPVGTPS